MPAIFILLFVTAALPAQITLRNPSFPREESITYIRSLERGSEMVHVEMRLVEPGSSRNRSYYRYRMQSDSKDMLVKLYADNLEVCDGNGLDISLRGFPWRSHDKAELVFLNGSDKFKLEPKVEGRETLRVNQTTYECHKVQMGLDGFIGSFIPKSYFYYAVEEPHILVRAEVAEMIGEDAYTIEIVSHSSSKK